MPPVPPVQPGVGRKLAELTRNQRSQTPPVPSSPKATTPKKRFMFPVLSIQPGTAMKLPRKPCSPTAPVPSKPRATTPQKRKRFMWPLSRTGRHNREQKTSPRSEAQGRGMRENVIVTLPWGWKVLWVVAKVLGKFMRLRKPSGIDRRPSHHQAPPDIAHPMLPEAPPLSPVLPTHHDFGPPDWKCLIGGLIDTIFSDCNEVRVIGHLRGDDARIFTDMVYEVYLCTLTSEDHVY